MNAFTFTKALENRELKLRQMNANSKILFNHIFFLLCLIFCLGQNKTYSQNEIEFEIDDEQLLFKIELVILRSLVLEDDSINVTIFRNKFHSYSSELIEKKYGFKRICKHWLRDSIADSTYQMIHNRILNLDFNKFKNHVFQNSGGLDGNYIRLTLTNVQNEIEVEIWSPESYSENQFLIEYLDLIKTILVIGNLDPKLIE